MLLVLINLETGFSRFKYIAPALTGIPEFPRVIIGHDTVTNIIAWSEISPYVYGFEEQHYNRLLFLLVMCFHYHTGWHTIKDTCFWSAGGEIKGNIVNKSECFL